MTALKFEEWLAATEQILLAQVGVGLLELIDCPYRDWYTGGNDTGRSGSCGVGQRTY